MTEEKPLSPEKNLVEVKNLVDVRTLILEHYSIAEKTAAALPSLVINGS
jgi:hypothetical protein